MTLLKAITRPEYMLRPTQIGRRVRLHFSPPPGDVDVVMPWGLPLRVNPAETLGRAVCALGLDDLPVCELIWRLCEKREICVDVGANIGTITSLMARRLGSGGRVLAFEPHPKLFDYLHSNIARWRDVAEVQASRMAISDRTGMATLVSPVHFKANWGTSFIADNCVRHDGTTVQCMRLDDVLTCEDVGVVKIDTEGHEQLVFEGMSGLLARKGVRDIVYEEYRGLPNELSLYLEGLGYRCFMIDSAFFGPRLLEPRGSRPVRNQAPSVLATRLPDRALALTRKRGWRVLKGR